MGRKRVISKSQLTDVVIPLASDVLGLVGAVGLVGAALIIPATPVIVMPIIKYWQRTSKEREEIKNTKFDKIRLWKILRRLDKQRDVELQKQPDGTTLVKLTDKGHVRFLRYKLEELSNTLNKKKWDGRWRIIIFDVPEKERSKRDSFRAFLNSLKFYQLQESVYLTPYPCEDEMEYLRDYYHLGKNAQMLVTNGLEDDDAFKMYFGLA